MSDTRVNNNIRFPKIPDNIDQETRDYFNDLERLLRQLLTGDVQISGNLYVGGEIFVPNAAGEIQQLTDGGHIGN